LSGNFRQEVGVSVDISIEAPEEETAVSYACTGAKYLSGKLFIDRDVGVALLLEMQDDLPESNLLDFVDPRKQQPVLVEITSPSWCGVGSNSNYPDDYIKVLRKTTGHADIVLTWEGGDGFSGFRVRHGVVTRHEVVQTLGKELK
jgi:hypothetical protein